MAADLDATLGATYVGVVVASCLFGITTLQFYTYWQRYRHDHIFGRLYIAVIWLVDTVKLVSATHVGYNFLITNYSNVETIYYSTWSLNLEFCLTSIIIFMVQLFFARRAWNFAKRVGVFWATPRTMRVMGVAVGLLATVQLAFGITTVTISWIYRDFHDAKKYRWTAIVWLGSAAFCDILMAYTLSAVLITRRTGVKHTDALINKALIYVINTGALTSVAAIFNLVLFSFMDNLIQLGVNFTVGTLYFITLLATLNARPYETLDSRMLEESEYDSRSGQFRNGRTARSSMISHSHRGHALRAINTGKSAGLEPGGGPIAEVSSREQQWSTRSSPQQAARIYSLPGFSVRTEVVKDTQHDLDGRESVDTRSENAKPGKIGQQVPSSLVYSEST